MATKRSQNSETETSPKRSIRLRSRNVESKDEDESDQGSSGMSLDVLAQVASETLKNEPKSPQKAKKKTTLKNISSFEVLTLEQILGLTEKTVLNMFTEMTSNELSRTFTYRCLLMPKECKKEFSSFGNEMRARAEVKKHIYDHLSDLEEEEKHTKIKFTAEPVHARRKRLLNAFVPLKFRGNKKQKLMFDAEHSKEKRKTKEEKSAKVSNEPKYVCKQENEDDENEEGEVNSIGFVPLPDKLKTNMISTSQLGTDEIKEEVESDQESENERERRIEENEQFIIDLLSKTQPHHDHCYTTIFGPRHGAEVLARYYKEVQDEEEKLYAKRYKKFEMEYLAGNKRVLYLDANGCAVKNPTPILFLRHRSPDENVPMVSVEVIIPVDGGEQLEENKLDVLGTLDSLDLQSLSSGEKPYPPMPKSMLAKKGRLGFDIADIPPDGSEEEMIFLQKKKSVNPLCREGREGNLGWEPKLALKYIRELKGRRKDENIPLVCKICQDKTFTAAATLMYHYRSHAGIKPFVCLICNTTFTRQHSLNYHMLIHNNQSRFTCKDCGRKFRHPSHFKEHLRRHTGETPFECMDCGLKFKTRNTYKRHLKTRHGKLLTASGIHQLSLEEFAKVRTRRYNISHLADISYTMPELTFTKMKKRKMAGRDPNYPNLPDIGYEMPELTFTKLKMKLQEEGLARSEIPVVDFDKIKSFDEIKKEKEDSESEDPELNRVLQVLSGEAVDAQPPAETEESEEKRTKAAQTDSEIQTEFSTESFVNKNQTVSGDVTVRKNLTASGDVTVNKNLSVSGDVTVNKNQTASGDVTVNKNQTVSGDVTV